MPTASGWRAPAGAAVLYLAAALFWTWPLATRLSSSIAWDLGDPMFNAWVLGWVSDCLLAGLRFDWAAFARLWDPPIFHPEQVTLAYSEHLVPQALLTLPVYAATRNAVLAYNIALLASFVLSAFGMFLLARAITGSVWASLAAGATFGFAGYRIDQLSHMQVLWSMWMPLAVLGFRRYFDTGHVRALVWGSLALVLQMLSCGYYAVYFPFFIAAYVLYELIDRRRLRDRRAWLHLAAAAAGVVLLVTPYLLPYAAVRAGTLGKRPLAAIIEFSADAYAYATASAYSAWWGGRIAAHQVPEGTAFPGLALTLLACAGTISLARDAWRRAASSVPPPSGARRAAEIVWAALCVLLLGSAVWILLTSGTTFHAFGERVRLRNFGKAVSYVAIATAVLCLISARGRAFLRGRPLSIGGFALLAAVAAMMLSMGPRIESLDRDIGEGPYLLFLNYVPGASGLRVPARFAMIAMFWLSLLAAIGGAAFARRTRAAAPVLAALSLVAVLESRPAEFALDSPIPEPEHAPLEQRGRLAGAQDAYAALHTQPRGVLLELPFGTTGWDIQFMHRQREHGWPLVNGFSGFFPPGYERTMLVARALEAADLAWWAVERSGATHVMVHEWAFRTPEVGARYSAWLRGQGAAEVASSGGTRLFALPRAQK